MCYEYHIHVHELPNDVLLGNVGCYQILREIAIQ